MNTCAMVPCQKRTTFVMWQKADGTDRVESCSSHLVSALSVRFAPGSKISVQSIVRKGQ